MRLNGAMTPETGAGVPSANGHALAAVMTTTEKIRLDGRAQALEHLLAVQFGRLSEDEHATIRGASEDELNTWLECALRARSAAEVLSVTPAELQSAAERGRLLGELKGRADVLADLLWDKFDLDDQDDEEEEDDRDDEEGGAEDRLDRLRGASLGELETWTARLLTASTLNEVLAPIASGTPGADTRADETPHRTPGLAGAAWRAGDRGELQGREAVLVQLMTLRFGPLPPCVLDAIRTGSCTPRRGAGMGAWTERVLTADTLDDMFYWTTYEEGFAQGFAKSVTKTLVRRLTGKFGEVPQAVLDTIQRAGVFDLLIWDDQVEAAASLDAVFAAHELSPEPEWKRHLRRRADAGARPGQPA